MKTSYYRIAGVTIGIHAESELYDTPNFDLYRRDDDVVPVAAHTQKDGEIHVFFREEEHLPDLSGMEVLYDHPLKQICRTPEGSVLRTFRPPGASEYALVESEGDYAVRYPAGLAEYFRSSTGCFNAAAPEDLLAPFGRFIFHCCYVAVEEGAILFTAPSGGGKTTQGRLWEDSGAGRIINGDRAVLEETPEGFLCHGLPIAGSSEIFLDESLPLRAIFVVNKAAENRAVPISGMDAFRRVYEQFLHHTWDPAYQLSVLDFTEHLLAKIPVYRLDCTISPEAVRTAQAACPRSLLVPGTTESSPSPTGPSPARPCHPWHDRVIPGTSKPRQTSG